LNLELLVVRVLDNYIVVNSEYFNLEIRRINNESKENVTTYRFVLREK